ncbi:hypothetical protein [Nakamurella lactea]|uniref:hypothetical protein n=1 Tax=Nakamurella lactea TaxID=459515 RepID=UPI000420A404|nr:hypothetical protein [Nakamurella lactea]
MNTEVIPAPTPAMTHIYEEGYVIPEDDSLVRYTHFHVVPRIRKGCRVSFTNCKFDFAESDEEAMSMIQEVSWANPVSVYDQSNGVTK